MESVLSPAVQVVLDKVCTATLNRAQVMAKFGEEFKRMEKGMEATKNLLADTMNLQSTNDLVKDQLREVIDEAQNVWTDCKVRHIYKENMSFLRSCLVSDVVFLIRVGKQLVDINKKMGEGYDSLSKHMSPNGVTHGIVGMGGLGKTTLAGKVFNDEEVTSHFKEMIWASVTQNFNAERIVNCMLKKLNRQPDVSKTKDMVKLQEGLYDQAYLIVMDDVWDKPDLFSF
ncbi:hypothetical protein M0R45_026040 [Rubus argutus]|uniref:NB-ARC domain-containing protein n=1 Tax=Rubus argutus TaxID=59490 RepID=A0AAW1WVT6_RUBAR